MLKNVLFEQGNIFIEFDGLTSHFHLDFIHYLISITKCLSTSMVIIVRVPDIKILVFLPSRDQREIGTAYILIILLSLIYPGLPYLPIPLAFYVEE